MTSSTSHPPRRAPAGYRDAHVNFNALVQEGLRRAPEERARAVKDFWNWMFSRY